MRPIIFDKAKERKCPDLKIDGKYAEVKTPTDKAHVRKINKNIRAGHAQANHVIIRLHSNVEFAILAAIAKGRFLSHDTLSCIEIKIKGVYHCFERSDFL